MSPHRISMFRQDYIPGDSEERRRKRVPPMKISPAFVKYYQVLEHLSPARENFAGGALSQRPSFRLARSVVREGLVFPVRGISPAGPWRVSCTRLVPLQGEPKRKRPRMGIQVPPGRPPLPTPERKGIEWRRYGEEMAG